jgi:hypothetical protein
MRYAEVHDYHGPEHGLMLLANGYLDEAYDLIAALSATDLADVPVGDGTLEDFDELAKEAQQKLAADAAADLPDEVMAHRVGDFVFTYHGAVLNECPAGLWIVILSYDPSVPSGNPYVTSGIAVTPIWVGKADGTTESFLPAQFPTALVKQNDLRATIDLPPLPHPATVTHDKPAVAPMDAEDTGGHEPPD